MGERSLQRTANWQQVWQTKADKDTSWYQDEPRVSLELIASCAPPGGRIIDIGGGSSVLAGRLAATGFDVTVLDVSAAAIDRAKVRSGEFADRITWIVADVTEVANIGQFDVWHDRAVFHFLTNAEDRRKYIDLASNSVVSGSHLVIGTFAMDGPEKCSGLPVERYDADRIDEAFHPTFQLIRSIRDTHTTPWGKPQSFFFAILQRIT